LNSVRTTVGVLSGGSGSSKFVSAFQSNFPPQIEPVYIANVGDNFWRFGVYICPDIDILTYCLAGILESDRGWGIKDDTKNFLNEYSRISGKQEWFALGDRDLAVSVVRTQLIRSGLSLSEATLRICKSLGVKEKVVPSTDNDVQTIIGTAQGRIHLQEFWVHLGGAPDVYKVDYDGIEKAEPTEQAKSAVSDITIILPANPVSSVMPTLSLPGMKNILLGSKVIAISPFVGGKVFSGPAPKFMRALGAESSSYGVANLYSDFLKIFLVDYQEDPHDIARIKDLGVECIKTNIRIRNDSDKASISREILELI
jgi:LPPG:FO 2-phospho-L-lactate transferase